MLSAERRQRPSGVDAIEELSYHDHICLLSDGPEDNLDLLVRFFEKGLEKDGMDVYVAKDEDAQRLFAYMRSVGFDIDGQLHSGRFMYAPRDRVVIKDGKFEPDSLLKAWEDVVTAAIDKGFSGVFGVGEMSWHIGNEPGLDRFLEFESRYNDICPDNSIIGLCNYDVTRFAWETLAGAMRTHPKVIINGLLCRNPYYVPSKECARPRAEDEFARLTDNTLSIEIYHRQLEEMNARLSSEMMLKLEAESSLNAMNRKLEILGRVTRHDMLNQLSVLDGYLTMSRSEVTDTKVAEMLSKAGHASDNIGKYLTFTRDYLDVGTLSPIWSDAALAFARGASTVDIGCIVIDVRLAGLKLMLIVCWRRCSTTWSITPSAMGRRSAG